uniref:Uncharacterized protein n=1 Tax=Ditylenchus dipsaci TaxID=166011 RepID=A0A915E1V0_9BILA
MVSDCSSSSNFSEVVVQHIHLDWTVDFQAKSIGGTALLNIDVLKQTSQIILDVKELAIDKIQVNNTDCKFVVEDVGVCGQRLSISTAQLIAGSKIQVSVHYKTTTECSALQFVDAKLTADKCHAWTLPRLNKPTPLR